MAMNRSEKCHIGWRVASGFISALVAFGAVDSFIRSGLNDWTDYIELAGMSYILYMFIHITASGKLP